MVGDQKRKHHLGVNRFGSKSSVTTSIDEPLDNESLDCVMVDEIHEIDEENSDTSPCSEGRQDPSLSSSSLQDVKLSSNSEEETKFRKKLADARSLFLSTNTILAPFSLTDPDVSEIIFWYICS